MSANKTRKDDFMIKPVKKYLLLEKVKIENISKSGIILSESKSDEKNVALVIDVGEDVTEIKKGNKVIFESYKTKNISHEQQDYLILSEDDVLAIVE